MIEASQFDVSRLLDAKARGRIPNAVYLLRGPGDASLSGLLDPPLGQYVNFAPAHQAAETRQATDPGFLQSSSSFRTR